MGAIGQLSLICDRVTFVTTVSGTVSVNELETLYLTVSVTPRHCFCHVGMFAYEQFVRGTAGADMGLAATTRVQFATVMRHSSAATENQWDGTPRAAYPCERLNCYLRSEALPHTTESDGAVLRT